MNSYKCRLSLFEGANRTGHQSQALLASAAVSLCLSDLLDCMNSLYLAILFSHD